MGAKYKVAMIIALALGVIAEMFHSWASFVSPTTFAVIKNGRSRMMQHNDNTSSSTVSSEHCSPATSVTEFTCYNINWNISAPCGAHKCFYRDSTNSDNIGYLIAQQQPNRSEDLVSQWEAIIYLQTKKGGGGRRRRHFLLGPPSICFISEVLASNLSSLAITRHKVPRYNSTLPVVVQKVQVAPKSSILIGCHYGRQQQIQQSLKVLLDSYVVDKDKIVSKLTQEFQSTIQTMEDEPWYARDWQAILDHEGNLYNMDVAIQTQQDYIDDNKFTSDDWIDSCCEMYDNLIQQVNEHYDDLAGISSLARQEDKVIGNNHICSTYLHSFRWDDLNFTKSDDQKCHHHDDDDSAYRTVSSNRNPNIGYSIANDVETDDMLSTSWELAKLLTNKYKIRHTILGRPHHVVPPPTSQNDILNGLIGKRFKNDSEASQRLPPRAQKVRRRSPPTTSPTYLFTCNRSMAEVWDDSNNELKTFLESVENPIRFHNRLKKVTNRIEIMIEEQTNQTSSLFSRLHGYIDATGDIYLLDLFRMFVSGSNVGRNRRKDSLSIAKACTDRLRNIRDLA